MLMVLIGGIISMWQMRREVFPKVPTGKIVIRVSYLGGSPNDVEEGVCIKVEEAVEGIEGVKRVRSTAQEGLGTVTLELEDDADQRKVLSDVESAVDRIDTFPKETEKPIITEVTNRVQVLGVIVYGEVPERTLKELAEQVRDELIELSTTKQAADQRKQLGWFERIRAVMKKPSNITQIDLVGARRYEVSIDVPEESLKKYGLTFDQVTDAVRGASLDLPAGGIETAGGEVLVRTKSQRYTGREFEDIIVLSRNDGTKLRLSEVANVVDGFEDTDLYNFFDGKPAVVMNIFRVGDQDAIEMATMAKQFLETKRAELPEGVGIATWFDRSLYLESRIDLLGRNALYGLILVFLCLTLFLDLRLAFWTTMGIPISFMGAFWVLTVFGVSVNMISLFALIIVLGIVVDDAIVIGENIYQYRQMGMDGVKAAIVGVREMAIPVTFAVLTTVVAFLPLTVTAGEIGKIVKVVPLVVIAVLMVSLMEALFILPAHLSRAHMSRGKSPLAHLQHVVQRGLDWFINKPYQAALALAVRWRYITLAIAISGLIITVGFVRGGHIKFVFFPEVDADNLVAEVTMPQGTPIEQTEQVVRHIEAAAERVRQRIDAKRKDGEPSIFRHVATTVGQQPFKLIISGQAHLGGVASTGDSHLAEINVELLSSEFRDIPSATVKEMWREEVGQVPGVSSLVYVSSFFSVGDDIHVEMTHQNFDKLLTASDELKERLATYKGVGDIDDTFMTGKPEVRLALTDTGRTLGLTDADLARQVRAAFYGAEAQRIQRGRDDVRVMVRYPEDERRSLNDMERMRIRLPDGVEAPFNTVARVTTGRGYAVINRVDRKRVVSVTASVDESVANANDINAALTDTVLPKMLAEYGGLSYSMEGQRREQQESLKSLRNNFFIAMLGIFALLGVQFRSYIQPLIVMSAIPFGLIGAVLGHVAMGLDLSFLSGFGVVALTGVVVNDSLIMIDQINRERDEGVPLAQVIIDCGTRRFRPILLTTLTTFLGLTPMLLERSLQARFLVPMAVSLAFGVAFATALTLLFVPTLYMILEDCKRLLGLADPDVAPEPAA
ncbi:MAG: MMPL family transporter [Phycisphaera sp.]|nr:MMPL family transporter [Phycisphaera sp.]